MVCMKPGEWLSPAREQCHANRVINMKPYTRKSAVWFRIVPVILMLLVSCSAMGDGNSGDVANGAITGRVFLDENADTFLRECDCDCGLKDISIRLYRESCAGQIVQTVKTKADGYFFFKDVKPGAYCVTPDIKMICEGFQPTKPITQKVEVKAGEETQAEWFAFDHWIDNND
jgi:hypothetical protein